MLVKQISVFIENRKGRLVKITRILMDKGIDIFAISIADTTNFGILRMIVNNPDEAVAAIHDAGYTVNTTDVIAVEVPDSPGGLNEVLEILDNNEVSVEYIYSFVRTFKGSALILFRVEDLERTMDVLTAAGVKVLTQDEVYSI